MKHDSAVLQYLSPALLGELRLEQCGDELCKDALFDQLREQFPPLMKRIAVALKYNALEPAEIMLEEGKLAHGCHILIEGNLRRLPEGARVARDRFA